MMAYSSKEWVGEAKQISSFQGYSVHVHVKQEGRHPMRNWFRC